MKKRWAFLTVLLLFIAIPAMAGDISFQPGMTQDLFKDFNKELGAMLLYRAVAPAAPLGLTGFDIGVEATFTDIDTGKDYWKKAFQDQDVPSYLVMPKLHVQKGLPFGIDLGLVYSKVIDSDIQYIGGEVKYAFIEGSAVWPAVAVRGSYSQIMGVDQLDFKTYGVEVTASKGFGVGVKIIPYVSIGEYWNKSNPKNLPAGINLSSDSFSTTRYAAGAKLQFLLLDITAEADYAEVPSYTLRVGLSW
jgi:hypothetical protein